MADYIDKNILCQAYVHVELPEGTTPEHLERIKAHLREFTEARAKFFVYPEVIVEVEFREGSLKSYLTIAGAIYLAIGNYGGFREGIDYLYKDIKMLSDTLVAESLFMTRARYDDVKRTEARTGVIGSLKQLVDSIIVLEMSIGHISLEEAAGKLRRIKEDADLILQNVRDLKDIEAIEDELDKVAADLPDECPHPKEKKPDDAAVILYTEALLEFRKRYKKKKK